MNAFPLTVTNTIDFKESCQGLFGLYEEKKAQINYIANMCKGSESIISYFSQGNFPSDSYRSEKMFEVAGAIKALNAEFWQKAMKITGVLDVMPAKDRSDWHEKIHKLDTPDFEPLTVVSTLEGLLMSRGEFFTDKVEGVFHSMSDTHVTNSPSGFTKRFILRGAVDTRFLSPSHRVCEVLEDLREVVCQVNGMPRPGYRTMYSMGHDICRQKEFGKWVTFDGGKFKIKLFKAGTAHVEIEEETALKLNMVLANRYPQAIPAKFRTATKYKNKKVPAVSKLISCETASSLYEYLRNARDGVASYGTYSKELLDILAILGAEFPRKGCPQFTKVPAGAIREIYRTRIIPNVKANQYYPTKKELAETMVEMAEIQEGDSILEPSAGQGGIAEVVRSESSKDVEMALVEIDEINCEVLKDKGFSPICLDFMDYSTNYKFDKIIMNPPFSEGRAKNHVLKGLEHLKNDGVLVACLPASFKDAILDNEYGHEYSEIFEDQFDNTKVRVILLKMTKK